jgi:glycosyltransferase involved in cell wall biosynthesis
MKVILSAKSVYPFHPVGGVQKYVYYFAKHLSRRGIDLEIVAPLDGGKPRTEVYEGLKYIFLRPAIYRYLEYPIGWLGVHLFARSLNTYLQNARFDLLHSFDLTGYQYGRNKHRRPVIAHIFTDNYLSNPISLKNPFHVFNFAGWQCDRIKEKKIKITPFDDRATKVKYWAQYLFKIKPMHQCLKQSEAVFFEADIFRDEVNALYRLDPRKSAVIPVGTDIPFIQKAVEKARISRKDLGLSDEDIVLITVNRLAADKGVDKIVLALAEIVKKTPNVKLIIVGSGYQEREIHKIIKEQRLEDHVRHFKDVPEDKLYPYYGVSDIYVSAFSYPGSSVSTLEAMACSLPIITTAQPWLVQGDRNGILLKDNSVAAIKEAVLDLLRRKSLKEQGKVSREIVQDFDWEKIAEDALRQYEQILTRSHFITSPAVG